MSDTKAAFSAEDLKRLSWHSRRGMLELDLLLVPFAENLARLSADELEMYRELLREEDQDLFLWLTRRAPAPAPRLQQMVEMILAANAQGRGW